MVPDRRITISADNRPVGTILDEFKRQSGANFVVNAAIIADLGSRSVTLNNVSLEQAMESLLSGTPYEHRIVGNNVTIRRRAASAEEVQSPVSGRVTNDNGNPLPGVTVAVKGTSRGVATDQMGEYSLMVSQGETIVFSFIGMKTQQVVFSGQRPINIVMKEGVQQVEEVVVTGIFRKSAESFTGSVVTITSEELGKYGSRDVLSTLRNIDPSFNIVENNSYGSDPNRLPDVQIRGSSSIPNIDELQDQTRTGLNTPLVVIDGFESTLQTLLDMNENEISLITILKDASATAMYGSRGANGVIVIETLVPAAGKLKISYRGSLNLEMPDLSSYNLMDAREKLDFEHSIGLYDRNYPLRQQYNYLLAQVNNGVDTYWMSKPLRVGIGHRHNLRVEGGDNAFRYSASAQYNNVAGVMKGSNKENFNGTVNLTYTYRNLRFNNNTIIGLSSTDESPFGTFDEYARMNPYFAPYDADGNLVKVFGLDGEGAIYRWGMEGVANPLWNSTLNTYEKTNTTTITNNLAIDWTIFDGLIVRGKLGIQKVIGGADKFYPAEHTRFKDYSQDDLLRKGQYINGNSRGNSIDAALNINYSHIFNDKHHIFAGLNLNAIQKQSTSSSITAEGFVNEDLDFLAMALQYAQGGKPSGTEAKSRAVGVAGNFNYTYDNRYYADLTITSDGNSAFGRDNRFATFWSLGFGWNIHNESFLRDNAVVNRLKLRGSAGTSGNQSFSAYQALTTYRYYTAERYYTWMGTDVANLGNPDLKWQQKMNYNLGVEADLFDRRLQLVLDTYIETTRDQISSINVPSSTGFTSYIDNIGKVENRGFELKLTGVIVRNIERGLLWSVTGSLAHNKNKIKTLSQALKEAQAETEADEGSNPYVIYKEGYSMDAIWVFPSLGIDPSNGRELFLDRNGSPTWKWSAANLVCSGLSQPKFYGNINTNLRWRNFQLTASFGYRFGGQVYNSTLISKVENADHTYNVDRRVKSDRWREPGDKALFKSIYLTDDTKKTSRFVQDERVFNCQSLSIKYDFDKKLIEKWHMSNLSLQATMNDLFYISSVKRERGTMYPFSRMMSFSLNITF